MPPTVFNLRYDFADYALLISGNAPERSHRSHLVAMACLTSRLPHLAPALASALLLVPATALAVDKVDKSAESGQQIFMEHCAGCHGTDAKGDGPNAANMKPPPADLTEISKRAGGTFPAAHILEVITYGGGIGSHSKGSMPVWGKIFSEEGGRGTGGVFYSRSAVVALKRYLEDIQQ